MRCPQCREDRQESTTEAGTHRQPGACDCNATAGDVTVFDEGGTVTAWAPQPDDEEDDGKAPERS